MNYPGKVMESNSFKCGLNSAVYLYYDRTLFLFTRPMRDKDTSALREMFQYSSLAEKPLDQWEIATD